MLTPPEVRRLREVLSKDPFPGRFEGYHLSTTRINLSAEPAPPVHREDGEEGVFTPPDQIFGTPTIPACLAGTEERYRLRSSDKIVRQLDNVKIVGNCALLAEDGTLYTPDPANTPETLHKAIVENRNDHHGYVLELSTKSITATYISREVPRTIELSAVFFHNLESSNYGSFIFRQLPQLLLLRRYCDHCSAYIVPDRTLWFTQALNVLGLPRRPIFTTGEVSGDIIRSVVFANSFDDEGFISPSVNRALLSDFRLTQTEAADPKRIFVSRSLSTISRPDYRVLLNEDEVEQIARKHDFTTIFPETLSLHRQATIFHGADVIVGPSGSGMLNCAFCHPGATVLDIESYNVTVRQHAKLYASSRARYGFLFGTPSDDTRYPEIARSWSVSTTALEQALEWAITPPQPL